jgi:ParB-like chromosome segregation protein Spo0J
MPDALTPDPATRRASLTVLTLPLDALKPHPENPRRHPTPGSPEWNTLKASLLNEYFDPIVWNQRNGMLVSGHLRTKVLREAGFTEADCVVVDMDEPTHKARMLAANRLTGEDDMQAVKDLLESLDTGEISTDLTGYSEAAIEALMNQVHQDEPAQDGAEPATPIMVACPYCHKEFPA